MRLPIFTVTVSAPLDTAWRAMRDPTLIRRWHGWDYDGLDGEIDQIYGRARASEVERTITIGGLDHRFELAADGDGASTRVTVTRPAPEERPDDDAYDEIEQGWITFLQQLRYFLERHPGDERTTVMLAVGGGAPLTPEELGLEPGPGLPEWYRTTHQAGLLVGDDALLVLVAHPAGGGRLILSAYGVSADELTAVGSRWAALLGERYADVTDA